MHWKGSKLDQSYIGLVCLKLTQTMCLSKGISVNKKRQKACCFNIIELYFED